jgi:hypothetical protein
VQQGVRLPSAKSVSCYQAPVPKMESFVGAVSKMCLILSAQQFPYFNWIGVLKVHAFHLPVFSVKMLRINFRRSSSGVSLLWILHEVFNNILRSRLNLQQRLWLDNIRQGSVKGYPPLRIYPRSGRCWKNAGRKIFDVCQVSVGHVVAEAGADLSVLYTNLPSQPNYWLGWRQWR